MNKILEKVVLLEVKGLIQIIVKFRAEKVLCMFLSPNILLRGIKYIDYENNCARLKKERLISFSDTIWFMISEKKYHKVGACFFTVVHAHAPEVSARHAENTD